MTRKKGRGDAAMADGGFPVNTMDSSPRAMAGQQREPSRRPADGPDAAAGAAPGPGPVFAADGPATADRLGRGDEAAFLAELVTHARAETPFCVGLFGPSGVGKSDLLERLLARAGALSAASTGEGPFCPDVVVARVDAAATGTEPAALLRRAVEHALADSHPVLAADLHYAGADPAQALGEAHGALDEVRRRLDAERQALEALTGRDARLVDTVIDTPGSAIDTYARAKRGRIERALRRFGFGGRDAVVIYKDLVREEADAGGAASRLGLVLRALWAFRGQTRLILTAVVLVLLAFGCATLRGDEAAWIGAVRDLGEKAAPVADWLQAHAGWLGPVQTALMLGAVLALALNLVRAARFVLPIARGVDLLTQDLDGRRRDLSSLIANQTRRVDTLASAAEKAAEAVGAAEARAGRHARSPEAAAAPGGASGTGETAFFAALAAAMIRRDEPHGMPGPAGPRRILVAIDGLDRRPAEAAAELLATAARLFGPGIVTVATADRAHLATGFGVGDTDPARASAEIERCVQLPYRVGTSDASDVARRAFALTLMAGSSGADRLGAGEAAAIPAASALDAAWRPREQETVAALSPFAGETPRAIKHFVNLYRVARADPRLAGAAAPVFTALALALALDAHGFPDDVIALERASHGEQPGESPVLRHALHAAREASGQPVELGQAQRALDVARTYTRRL